MRYREPDVRDACDGIIGRSMKEWVDGRRPPASTKRQIMGKAAGFTAGSLREPELWSLVLVALREAAAALYGVLAREPRVLSMEMDVGMAAYAGHHLHEANYELLYSSSGGVGMLSLMG
jgi:hypothetical protein